MRNATIRTSRSWWAVSSDPHAVPSPAAAHISSDSVFGASSAMQRILILNCATPCGETRFLFHLGMLLSFANIVQVIGLMNVE